MREPRARHVAAVALLVAVLVSVSQAYRLRHYIDFGDEEENVVAGWLTTEGETLYGTVFSHHMPLPYILAHVVARLSPSDSPAHFRVVPWLLDVLVAWSLVTSPVLRRYKAGARAFAGVAFLVLSSVGLPVFFGHLLLADNVWGAFFVVTFFRLLLPLTLGEPVTAIDFRVGGSVSVLALAGSLIAVYPVAYGLLVALLALPLSPERRRAVARYGAQFLFSALGTALALILWLLRWGDVSGLFEQALLFNTQVYAQFLPLKSSFLVVLQTTFGDWSEYLRHAFESRATPREPESLFAVLSLATAALGMGLGIARARLAACVHVRALQGTLCCMLLGGTLVLLRMRGGQFRALPQILFVLSLLAVSGAVWWARGHEFAAAVIGAALAIGLGRLLAAEPSYRAVPSLRTNYPSSAAPAARFIREHSSPEERIASFNITPRIYLVARRKPATDSLFYLPWQARWEEQYLRSPDTLEQLRRRPPKFVYMRPYFVWNLYPWESYAEQIDRFVKLNYRRLEDPRFEGHLWELKPGAMASSSRPSPRARRR